MAAIETIVNNYPGAKMPYNTMDIINVHARVGRGEANNWGDVVAVQSLLAYYKKFHDFAPFISPARPNGICDPKTIELIAYYQGHINADVAKKGHRLTVDGKVGRAKGKAYWAPAKEWTIASLGEDCQFKFVMQNGGRSEDYISDLRRKFPEINAALVGII